MVGAFMVGSAVFCRNVERLFMKCVHEQSPNVLEGTKGVPRNGGRK